MLQIICCWNCYATKHILLELLFYESYVVGTTMPQRLDLLCSKTGIICCSNYHAPNHMLLELLWNTKQLY